MRNILLQGSPGIGKTTLTKKVASKLKDLGARVTGFYTEEVRDASSYRIGFDIVALDSERGILARKSKIRNDCQCQYQVGSYNVNIDDFEKIALPTLDDGADIFIIDEIGKMELFSKKFEARVQKLMYDKDIRIIATVPLKGGGPFVQKLKDNKSNQVINVTEGNRNKLLEEIIPRFRK